MKNFDIPTFFRSSLLSALKDRRRSQDRMKQDTRPFCLDFVVASFFLPRDFGFCYGVENAIDRIYFAIDNHPGKRIFVLSELIHNPQVNDDLRSRGIDFLMDTYGNQRIPFDELTPDDIVIIPAFGISIEIERILAEKGILTMAYDTTCPFVRKVWNKVEKLVTAGYTLVIHGKYQHEETRATVSRVQHYGGTCVVIKDQEEAELLGQYIRGQLPMQRFFEDFAGKHSAHFQPDVHLKSLGVVNQTTMLAFETHGITQFLKGVVQEQGGNFADTKDTLCYATNDNQRALEHMLAKQPLDKAFIIGGYNSSNTTNLFRFCAQKIPTYFINSDDNILSPTRVRCFDFSTKEETERELTPIVSTQTKERIALVLGASCPDILVERVITRILSFTMDKADIQARFATLLQEASQV